MQDITKAKCDGIATGTEGRLIDKRDGKIYWVAKLKNNTDNNALCWMTQNLDYDGGAVEGYTGSDTADLVAGTNFNSDGIKQYYNPGEYVYTKNSTSDECNGATTDAGLGACTNNGWTPFDKKILTIITLDSSWIQTNDTNFYDIANYVSADDKMICTKNINSWFGDMDSDYIPCRMYNPIVFDQLHYSAGNYYNWYAATNGTGDASVTSGNASGSICPTGWKLPLSSSGNNSNDGSFYKLVTGLTGATIALVPHALVYGGVVYNRALSDAGSNGYYWSATALNASKAYSLKFGNSYANSSYTEPRSFGYSVRCVAR